MSNVWTSDLACQHWHCADRRSRRGEDGGVAGTGRGGGLGGWGEFICKFAHEKAHGNTKQKENYDPATSTKDKLIQKLNRKQLEPPCCLSCIARQISRTRFNFIPKLHELPCEKRVLLPSITFICIFRLLHPRVLTVYALCIQLRNHFFVCQSSQYFKGIRTFG